MRGSSGTRVSFVIFSSLGVEIATALAD